MIIIGLHIIDRIKEGGELQKILTKYAFLIKTRLGFHEVSKNKCGRHGIIILQLIDNKEEIVKFIDELSNIRGINIQTMEFNN